MSVRALTLAALILLGGCAATIPPVQVTRFHIDHPIAPGMFAITNPGASLETGTYEAAVTRALGTLGFTPSTAAKPPYRVTVDVQRDTRDATVRHSPVTIGIGGGSFGGGVGIGVGTSFGVGKPKANTTVITRLSVRIVESTGGAAVWEGRAETQSPSSAPAAQPGLAAEKLATALFKDFPGESGRTITVP